MRINKHLLDDLSYGLLLNITAAFRHEKAVLHVQLFHVFEHILVLGIDLPLLLPHILDQAAQHPVLIEEKSFVAGQEQRLVHLKELEIRVHIVVVVLRQPVPVSIKRQFPLVDLEQV